MTDPATTNILEDNQTDTQKVSRKAYAANPDPIPEPAPIVLGRNSNVDPLNLYMIDRIDNTDNRYQIYMSFIVLAGSEEEARHYAQERLGRTDSHLSKGIRYSENTFTNPKISRCTRLDLTQAGVISSVFKGNE